MENGQQRRSAVSVAIRDFPDLEVWQVARNLPRQIYDASKKFPKNEAFWGLISQIRRAAVSITANIAEGFGRFSYQENIQYGRQSRASTYEVRDHLTTAVDPGHIAESEFHELNETATSVIRLLNGYSRATTKRKDESGQGARGARV
jgi:four helix bundle protein